MPCIVAKMREQIKRMCGAKKQVCSFWAGLFFQFSVKNVAVEKIVTLECVKLGKNQVFPPEALFDSVHAIKL